MTIVLFFAACGGSSAPSTSTRSSPSPTATAIPSASPLTDFEEALQYIRNGQYTYVWVFSRKDGKPLQPDDSTFLRTNAPQVVDWAATKDKKKVVAGTNFNLEEGNLELIKKRFVVEDYSGK
ncbi:MAG TPA: hypothetical protein VF088_10640 [Pyrinomonadaceae bacterium]